MSAEMKCRDCGRAFVGARDLAYAVIRNYLCDSCYEHRLLYGDPNAPEPTGLLTVVDEAHDWDEMKLSKAEALARKYRR